MEFFNKTKVQDQEFPIRRITITPTSSRERPYVIYVGQHFPVGTNRDALKIIRIEYRLDMYEKYGDKVYDVYAEKTADGFVSRWKRFENIEGIDIEYDLDF